MPSARSCPVVFLAALVSVGAASACISSPPALPAGLPPTPGSINRENPGGDSHDPHETALLRQLESPWGGRRDKDNQLVVPVPDARHYKRVRYWALDHFVGFRYGRDFHVVNVVFLHDLPEGSRNDSATCLRKAEKWGRPQLKAFEVKLGKTELVGQKWEGEDVLVKTVDGHVDFGFKRRKFSAAYAAYPAYPDTCLIFAMAVPWGDHEDIARRVRDRWVSEGVPLMKPLTPTRPFRK